MTDATVEPLRRILQSFMQHLQSRSGGGNDPPMEGVHGELEHLGAFTAVLQAIDEQSQSRLGLTRRQFLMLCSVVAGVGVTGITLAGCSKEQIAQLLGQIVNRPVRRNIASLAPSDPIITSYESAIQAMKALPMSDGRNWTRQAQIHNDTCRHAGWLFFPWHRAYLYFFERICRELSGDNSFALPYWNWTTSPQIPAVFWDQTSQLYHSNRVATSTSTASAGSVGSTVINNLLGQTNFLIFAGPAQPVDDTAQFGPGYGVIEGTPHNYIHGWIGGTMGAFMSPLDPIFWPHHNRVDELWVEWNIIAGHPNTNDGDWTNTQFTDFFDRDGSSVTVSVLETILYPLLSYRFDTQTP